VYAATCRLKFGIFSEFCGYIAAQQIRAKQVGKVRLCCEVAHLWCNKKGGHPARPYCQVSPACGGYDIRQTETRNPLLLLQETSLVARPTVLGNIPSSVVAVAFIALQRFRVMSNTAV
jgi:hypothetical protein